MLQSAPKEILDEITKEYESTLSIPNSKPSHQWILMPVGLIGAGKTTVVKPLAERLNLIKISTDDIREKLRHRGYSYEGCRDIVQELAKKYLGLGYSIAFDANTGSKTGLEYNKKSAGLFPSVRQIFIHINPPEEFIVNKLKNYPHTWLFKDAEHALKNLSDNKRDFSVPDVNFIYTFDTSKADLPDQLQRCVTAIKNEIKK